MMPKKRLSSTHILAVAVAGAVAAVYSHPASANIWTWNNSTSNWNSAANWSSTTNPGTVPASGSSTELDFGGTGSTAYTASNDLGTFVFGTIKLNSSASVAENISGNFSSSTTNEEIQQNGTGAFSIASSFTLSGATLLLDGGGSGTVTLGGTINNLDATHLAGVTKSGASTFVLSGNSGYKSPTTLSGGVLSVSAMANIGSSSNIGTGDSTSSASNAASLILDGGTLQYTGIAVSTNRLFTLTQNGGTIDGSGSGALNLNNGGSIVFSGSGTRTLTLAGSTAVNNTFGDVLGDGSGGATTVAKTGVGTWTLSAANTYTGATSVSAGAMVLNKTSGTVLGATAITVGNGVNGNGTLIINGTNTINTSTAGSLVISGGTSSTGQGTLTFLNTEASASVLTLANASSGFTDLTFGSAGSAAILNFNVGGSTFATDKIAVNKNVSIGAGGAIVNINVLAGSSIAAGTYPLITNAALASGSSPYTALSLGTITNGGTYRFSLSQTGSGLSATAENLVITAAATTPANAFWGGAQGSAWNTFNNPNTTASTNWLSGRTGSDTNQLPGSTTNVYVAADSAANFTITLGQNFTVNSLSFTGTGTAAAANAVTIAAGNTLTLNATSGFTDAQSTPVAYPAGTGLVIQPGSAGHTINAALVLGNGQRWEIDNTGNALTVNGVISGTANLLKTGSGTLVLAGTNTFADSTQVALQGGTLDINSASALGNSANLLLLSATSGTITIDNTSGAPLTTSNYPQTWHTDFTFAGTNSLNLGNGAVSLDNGTRTITVSASTLTVGGVISDVGTYGITKAGAGTLVLAGANSYKAGTTINNGVLTLGIAQASTTGPLGGGTGSLPTGLITFSGGTLQYTSVNQTDYSSKFATTAGQAFKIDTNGRNVTLASVLASSGGTLTKSGSGTLTLTNANTYTGLTAINNGTLAVNTVSTGSNAQPLGEAGSLTLGVPAASSGTLRYTGGAATLDKNITALGNGGDTIQNAGTGTLALSGTLSKNGTTLTLNATAAPINVTGHITGTLTHSDLVLTGGTTTLGNANSYAGSTLINSSGTLIVGIANAIPSASDLFVGDAALGAGTLDASGFANAIHSLTMASNGTLKAGLGNTLTSSAAASLAGTLSLSGSATLSNYQLLTYTSKTGIFAVTNAGSYSGYTLVYKSTELDLQHVAAQTLTAGTPGTPINSFVGQGIALTGTLTNTASSGSADLAAALTSTGTLNITTLASSSGATVAVGTPSTVTGIINTGATAGLGQTWQVTNTDSTLTPATATAGGTIDVYNHAAGSISGSTLTFAPVIVGYSGPVNTTGSLIVTNTAAAPGGGLTAASSAVGRFSLDLSNLSNVAAGGTATLAGALAAGQSVGAFSQALSLTYQDASIYTGASGNLGTSTITLTGTVLAHASGALNAVTNPVNALHNAGGLLTGLSLTDGAGSNAGLVVTTVGGGVSGVAVNDTVAGGGAKTGLAAALASGTVGLNQTQNFTIGYKDQTLPGADPATYNATAAVTVNVYNPASAIQNNTATTLALQNNASGPAADLHVTAASVDGSTTQNSANWSINILPTISQGSTGTVATLNPSGLLNGIYTANFHVTAGNSATIGGAPLAGTATGDVLNNAALSMSATVSGNAAATGTVQTFLNHKFAGYGLTNSTNVTVTTGPTTATFLDSQVVTADRDISMTFSAKDQPWMASDKVAVSGSGNDVLYVLEMTYDTRNQALAFQGGQPFLGCEVAANAWTNAALTSSSTLTQILGDYDPAADFHAGYYGYTAPDANGQGIAWAVVQGDHTFAVIPEPASLSFLGVGFIALFPRRTKRSRPTV
jgi:fibronectin-binding autotransporter adhesin